MIKIANKRYKKNFMFFMLLLECNSITYTDHRYELLFSIINIPIKL